MQNSYNTRERNKAKSPEKFVTWVNFFVISRAKHHGIRLEDRESVGKTHIFHHVFLSPKMYLKNFCEQLFSVWYINIIILICALFRICFSDITVLSHPLGPFGRARPYSTSPLNMHKLLLDCRFGLWNSLRPKLVITIWHFSPIWYGLKIYG